MKKPNFKNEKKQSKSLFFNTNSSSANGGIATLSKLKYAVAIFGALLVTGCQKEVEVDELDNTSIEADFALETPTQTRAFGDIHWPGNGNNCWLSAPPAAFWGAGWSGLQSWHRVARNQNQLVSAINHVNQHGGTIYIDATFAISVNLPTITRDNVTILSRGAHKIYDTTSGGNSATQLFRVEAKNFTMKNVTILGVGHTNPGNPSSWSGKRSGVTVTKDNALFDRVFIRYFTHAGIRLENGSGHRVLNSTLTNQNRSDLGYGVLLRNSARNVLIKRNRFDANSHSVATTGGINQSYRAEGNWTTNTIKWHFDVHMGPDNWGGKKVEIVRNVSNGNGTLLLVRGPFVDGVFVNGNLYNNGAGKLVELKPDRTFSRNGTTFTAGNFYSPFGLEQQKARVFFGHGEITNNCANQNYNSF